MSGRSYGYKYDELGDKYQTAAEIAKLMRRDIKQAIADGLLPTGPKYSVRVENYSGGRSINIEVQEFPNAWQQCDGYKVTEPRVAGRGRELCRYHYCAAMLEISGEPNKAGADRHEVLTADAEAAKMTLERIHTAYNHDGSDSMTDYFDVNYYGGVSFESASGAAFRAAEGAKLKARRDALDSAAAAGEMRRVVVYQASGRKVIHDAVDVKGRVKLLCGAATPRMAFGADAGAELTCSRCVKREASRVASAPKYRARIQSAGTAGWNVVIVRVQSHNNAAPTTITVDEFVAASQPAALELAGAAIARLSAK